MKIRAAGVLTAVNLVLLGLLALMWVKPDGTPRNIHWVAPEPLRADLANLVPAFTPDKQVDASRFLAMLERPLFSITRRPPPPPPREQPVQAPDNLSTARVTGIVRGEKTGYIILLINGKQQRIQQNQGVEGWTLKNLGDRQVTFTRGDQSQTLNMQRADVSKYTGMAQAAPAPAAPAVAQPQANRSSQGANVGAGTGEGSAAADAPPKPRPAPRFGP